jgi:flagellar assembly factor FliW
VSEMQLRGKILGFEEYDDYIMQDEFGDTSPFRLLSCKSAPISFVVVNPYHIVEDYSFEVEDSTISSLALEGNFAEDIAVLSIVRPNDETLYVNLRSPLVINTRNGHFVQVILQNETYGVSVPFSAQKKDN